MGTLDPAILEELVESFAFNEIKKRGRSARHCNVLCNTVRDKTTLLEIGGVILPLELRTIFITFAPTADDTTHTTLPKELRLALLSHKPLLQGGPHPIGGLVHPKPSGIHLSGSALNSALA